jgi:hypothetical protein
MSTGMSFGIKAASEEVAVAKAYETLKKLGKDSFGSQIAEAQSPDSGNLPHSGDRSAADDEDFVRGKMDLYADMKKKLIANGIPAEEIAFIHDAKTPEARAVLFRKIRDGSVRILIANSKRLATGANIQTRLFAAHHLDAPWKPAEIEQRDGRIVRRGNMYADEGVRIMRYVTKGSFDAYMWQTNEQKAAGINDLRRDHGGIDEIDSVDSQALEYAELKALASKDPRIMEYTKLRSELAQLEAAARGHADSIRSRNWDYTSAKSQLANMEEYLPQWQKAKEEYEAWKASRADSKDSPITVGGKSFEKNAEAGEALIKELIKRNPGAGESAKGLGNIAGWSISSHLRGYEDLKGNYKLQDRQSASLSKGRLGIDFDINLESDQGTAERVKNALEDIPFMVDKYTARIPKEKERIAELAKSLNEPFKKADRLAEVRKKVQELEMALRPSGPKDGGQQGGDEGGKGPSPEDNPPDDLALSESRDSSNTRQSRSKQVSGPTEAGIAAADIIKSWERMFDVPIRVGGFSRRAAGIYKVLPEVVRAKESHFANLAVAAHEVAHHIDKQTHIAGGDSRHAPTMPQQYRGEVSGLDYEPKGRLFEGFAEFVRHYITEDDAEVIAPNFHKWFTKEWMRDNPRWGEALKQARQQARQFADQTVFQRISAAIGRPGDDLSWNDRLKQRASAGGRVAFRQFVDRGGILKAIQDESEKRGADYSEKAGVYDLWMAYDMSANANAAQALDAGVHALTDGRKLSESLWGLSKHLNNDVERDEAVAYAWARHTLHEHNYRPGYNTGLDVEDADRMVQYVEADPGKLARYKKVAVGLSRYADGLLDMLVDAGALAPDARNRMKQRYRDYYFPLLRMQENQLSLATGGQRFVNLPPAVRGRSRKGSGRPIMDPFDALVSMTIQRYSRAAKARVAQTLAETLDPQRGGVEGMGGLMDRVEPKRIVHEGTIGEIMGTLVTQGVVEGEDARAMGIATRIREGMDVSDEDLQWFAQRHGLTPTDDLSGAVESEPDLLSTISLWRTDFTPSAKKATVVIHDRSGKPVLYEMDRYLYDTATGMDGLQFGAFGNIVRQAAQVFKAGAVGMSTGFGVSNIIRDFFEYQGRAQHVKGAETLTKPLEMLWRYIGYKARQMSGKPTDDALIESFEAAGGKLFTRLGSDIATRQRTRQRKLGQSHPLSSPWHIKDAVLSATEGLQDLIAWTDAPPRLAEMEAALKGMGFEARGSSWFDSSGQKVDLPEYARVKALNAAGEATINFKRAGTAGRYIDAFLPFANATLQASYREAGQVAGLRKIGDRSDARQQQALRYIVYLSAAASVGLLAWLLRHDDDDYREQNAWLKQNYWTWGINGHTYLRIPKPRDLGMLASNMVEAILDRLYHDDSQGAVQAVIGRQAMNRLPDGGGPIRAGVEALVADYDYFRGRPLTPDHLKDDPKSLQATPYTLELSKTIGKLTGPTLGISPIQAEHLLNGSTGGAYRRIADVTEAAFEGRLGPEHVPFLRALAMNRHQARSMDDFYTEWNRTKLQAKWEQAQGGDVASKTATHKSRLDDYAELMTDIRKLEKKDVKGRRSGEYDTYLVGLAREALNREPLESDPSPFVENNLPDQVKEAIVAFGKSCKLPTLLDDRYNVAYCHNMRT